MWNNWKHYQLEDFTEENESSRVNYLSFVSISMKQDILLQGVHRKRITRKETSTKIEEKMIKRDYKDKGKKCYISKEKFDDNDDEVVYVAMKDQFDEEDPITLVTCMNKNDRWIIDSGCSHHMIGDKSKFVNFTQYDGNSVRFGNDAPCQIKGKGSIKLTEKISCDNAYHVEGLNYNLLSVSQLGNVGCKVEFGNKTTKIYDTEGKLIGKGDL